ncbi:MAG: twin-arginine translocase subunit TatC, partial [Fimbriimonadaceae bacterium]
VKGKNIIARSSSGGHEDQEPEEFRAPLTEHLEELRRRILRAVAILVVAWIAAWYMVSPLYKALLKHIKPAIVASLPPGTVYDERIQNAPDAFMLLLKLSFIVGLFVAIPFIIFELWAFIGPGLKEKEKAPIKKVLPFSVALFFLGSYFCWLILPSAYGWFSSFFSYFPGVALLQDPMQMMSFSSKMMLAFGVCFQLPIIVFALGKIGLLTAETLTKNWRQATVAIFFIAAAITPSNDPISMLMMAIPLCVLFAISVYAVKVTTKPIEQHEEELDDLD